MKTVKILSIAVLLVAQVAVGGAVRGPGL